MRNVSVAFTFSILIAANVAQAAPVIVPEGVADPIVGDGTGLCAASAVSTSPSADFGLQTPSLFKDKVNEFIELHAADRVQQVIRTPFDLSNNYSAGLSQSYGDFRDAVPGCKMGGCDFFINDGTTAFGSRLRGYFNVTADLANKPIHFGFYGDDAFAFTVFGKNNAAYPVVTRPAEIGFATWRVTNQVTFSTPGLYPVEVLYMQIGEHAALEMSMFIGDFTDFEKPVGMTGFELDDVNFKLLPATAFFQTLGGTPSLPDLEKCAQCDRVDVNGAGNGSCEPGAYCNDAALCAPCDSDNRCGATCASCGGDTPFCTTLGGGMQCANCRTDDDCDAGVTCDPTTKSCKTSPAGVGGGGGSAGSAGSGGAAGSGGGGGSGASGGSGGSGGTGTGESCACRLEASPSSAGSSAIWGIALAAAAWARSRRR